MNYAKVTQTLQKEILWSCQGVNRKSTHCYATLENAGRNFRRKKKASQRVEIWTLYKILKVEGLVRKQCTGSLEMDAGCIFIVCQ